MTRRHYSAGMSRRVIVVGAGAWGLPAAAELARRGHEVTLIDQWGAASPLASSTGATRIWRLAHPDRVRVRLAQRSIDAWKRVESRTATPCLQWQGLLWRDSDVDTVAAALSAENVSHQVLDPADVGHRYPGLRPSDNAAVWQPDAGIVLAANAMAAAERAFHVAGGAARYGQRVASIEDLATHVLVHIDGADDVIADQVVVAAGPWSQVLLESLQIHVPLLPVLHQVSYVGGPAEAELPCLIDGQVDGDGTWLFGLPTPGRGLKIGLEIPLREFDPLAADHDREPSPMLEGRVEERMSRELPAIDPRVTGSEVCTYAFGPDSRFVIDTAADGRVVFACGDSGEGFKFSALMGEVLADLADGLEPGEDVASFSMARFNGRPPVPVEPTLLGH